MVLSAGDLPLDYLDFIISTLNKPLFFVFGNHYTEDIKRFRKDFAFSFAEINGDYDFSGAVHLGTKVITEGKLILMGLGGSMRYNNGANQFTDFQMTLEMIKLFPKLLWNRIFRGRFVDILLTHAPPRGIHDREDKCHVGFKSFLWFMKTFKPRYLIHGHIHLYDLSDDRSAKWEDTTVINAYGHYVINVGDKIAN